MPTNCDFLVGERRDPNAASTPKQPTPTPSPVTDTKSTAAETNNMLAQVKKAPKLGSGNDANRVSTVQLQKTLLDMEFVNPGTTAWIEPSDLEFTKKLGSGTGGKVYQGLYKGKEVAIKVLKEMTNESQIQEFKKEFHIMSAIKSSSVVQFYGACLEPKLCMVMEMCARGSLYHVLKHDKYLQFTTWKSFLDFADQTVRGIQVLHNYNPPIYHR